MYFGWFVFSLVGYNVRGNYGAMMTLAVFLSI